jgi:hypothetical protein
VWVYLHLWLCKCMLRFENIWYQYPINLKSIKSNYLALGNRMMTRMTPKAVWMKITIFNSQTITIVYLLVAPSTYSDVWWHTAQLSVVNKRWSKTIDIDFIETHKKWCSRTSTMYISIRTTNNKFQLSCNWSIDQIKRENLPVSPGIKR